MNVVRPSYEGNFYRPNGFTIVYDRDVTQQVGDGFFFTLGYPGN